MSSVIFKLVFASTIFCSGTGNVLLHQDIAPNQHDFLPHDLLVSAPATTHLEAAPVLSRPVGLDVSDVDDEQHSNVPFSDVSAAPRPSVLSELGDDGKVYSPTAEAAALPMLASSLEEDPEEAPLRNVLNFLGVDDDLMVSGRKCLWPFVGHCVNSMGQKRKTGFVGSILAVVHASDVTMDGIDISNAAVHGDIGKLVHLTHIRLEMRLFDCDNDMLDLTTLPLLKSFIIKDAELDCKLPKLTGLQNLFLVDLSNNFFRGELGERVCDLPSLEQLHLSHNELSGQLPACLAGHPELAELDVSYNSFHGEFHSWFRPMPKLMRLELDYNRFTGHIPPDIHVSTQLNYLSGADNALSGELPESIGKLQWLRTLDLHSNELSGPLPESFGNLGCLMTVNLGDNALEGQLPESLGNLSQLGTMELGFNHFTGTLPTTLGNLKSLQILRLNGNSLVGPIPRTITLWRRLEILNLGHNQNLGELPASFFPAKQSNFHLLQLRIPHSGLSGHIPERITHLRSLQVIDLSNNMFDGSIPNQISMLSALKSLELQHNQLVGTIPIFHPKQRLLELDLSYNDLEGEVPKSIGLPSFQRITLSHNKLSGKIPKELGNIVALRSLDLSWNYLAGAVPDSIAFITSLQRLDLSSNYLNDFPKAFVGHASLRQLFLRGNFFRDISVLKHLDKLAELDISVNPIMGEVSELSKAKSLERLNISQTLLSWTKTGGFTSAGCLWLPEGQKLLELPYLTDLDISWTTINLDVNKWFRTLAGLPNLRSLAANSCNLLGSITHRMLQFSGEAVCETNHHSVSLRLLTNLELQSNHIHGIQPDSLAPLSSLQFLDVSDNGDLLAVSHDIFWSVENVDLRGTGVRVSRKDFEHGFRVSDRRAYPQKISTSFICFEPKVKGKGPGSRIWVFPEAFAGKSLCRCNQGFGGLGTDCQPCGPGSYSIPGRDHSDPSVCEPCQSGSFSADSRQTACQRCHQGSQAASLPGATSERSCGCRGGYIGALAPANENSTSQGTVVTCIKCTTSAQAYCQGCLREETLTMVFTGCKDHEDNSLGPEMYDTYTWPGYWRGSSLDEPTKCWGLGGSKTKTGFGHAVVGGREMCKLGHTGFCCTECEENFYRKGSQCVKCRKFQPVFFTAAVVVVLTGAWFLWSFRNSFLVTLHQRQSVPNELRAVLHLVQPQLSALVKGMQLCAVARVLQGSEGESKSTQMVWFDFSLVTDVLHLSCLVNDHLSQWLHVLFAPIRPFITILLILGVLRLIPGRTKYGLRVTSYKVAFVVLDLTFIGTMTKLSLTSRCITIPGNTRGRMAAMTWLFCDKPEGLFVWWYSIFWAISMVMSVLVLRLHSARVYHARCAQLASVSQRAPVRVVSLTSDPASDVITFAIELTPSDDFFLVGPEDSASAVNMAVHSLDDDLEGELSRGGRTTSSSSLANTFSSTPPVVRGPPRTRLGKLAAYFQLRVEADPDLLMQEVVLDGFTAAYYALLVEKLASRGCYTPRRVMHFELEDLGDGTKRWLVRFDLKATHLSPSMRDNLRARVLEAKSDRRLAAAPTLQACLLTSAWERRQLHPILVGTSFWTLMPFGALAPQTLQMSSAALAAIAATHGSEFAFAGTCTCIALFLTWRPHVLSTTSWGLSVSFAVAGLCSLLSGELQYACMGLLFVAFWLFVAALFIPAWRRVIWPYCLAVAIHEIKWSRVEQEHRASKTLKKPIVAYSMKPWRRANQTTELPKRSVLVPQRAVEGFILVKVESVGQPKSKSKSKPKSTSGSSCEAPDLRLSGGGGCNGNWNTDGNSNSASSSAPPRQEKEQSFSSEDSSLHFESLQGECFWVDTRDLLTCVIGVLWRLFSCLNTSGVAKRMQPARRRGCCCRALVACCHSLWCVLTCGGHCLFWRSQLPTPEDDDEDDNNNRSSPRLGLEAPTGPGARGPETELEVLAGAPGAVQEVELTVLAAAPGMEPTASGSESEISLKSYEAQ